MARDFQFYITRATEAFERGFTTLSARKEALADLNYAYDRCRDAMAGVCLDSPRQDDGRMIPTLEALCWGLPGYPHQWRGKHTQLVHAVFPDLGAGKVDLLGAEVARIEQVIELRAAIAGAEIVRVERKNAELDERVAKVRESLADPMQRRGEQYAYAIKLGEIFGNMPVTANMHWVVNEHGHGFWRTFWYLNGELTPLNVLVAARQELERRAAA